MIYCCASSPSAIIRHQRQPYRPVRSVPLSSLLSRSWGLIWTCLLATDPFQIFMLKLIEREVAVQLLTLFQGKWSVPKHQYRLRRGHSTETFLIRLLSDIHQAMVSDRNTLLALLVASAASNLVEHRIADAKV